MKKILFFTVGILLSITSFTQNALTDSTHHSIESDSAQTTILSHKASSLEKITKAEADSAYIKNDFTLAIQIYEALLNKGENVDIYYNLGNSYYKSDEIAKAILNYERALLLQPGNADIRANLEIARSKTIDKVEPIPEVFFVSWIKSLINSMSVDAWGICGIIFFLLLITSLYFFIFSKQILLKKVGFIASIISLIIVVMANVFANEQKDGLLNRNSAIVTNPSVTVRSTPSESGTSLFVIHEGHKVSIKDATMKGWKEIRLEDGKVGWIPSTAIEMI